MIDAHLLTRTAFDILARDLENHGNVLSVMHRAALYELVDTFTGYVVGLNRGRRAFGLPCGMGKTSAVVAFLVALHQLGHNVAVSVAASKVDALCKLKQDLVAHGVPIHLIGLKHAVADASEPSTGNESYPFQLVTHARVRSGRDFELFGKHDDQPRALCIYDETFLRSDAFAFRARSFYSAVAVLAVEAEGCSNPLMRSLVDYLRDAENRIRAALAQLQASGDPDSNGIAVELAPLEVEVMSAFAALIGQHSRVLKGFEGELQDLLSQSQDTLRVVGSEQGDGVVTSREVVPLALSNVVILDASAPIRELAHLDPTVSVIESFRPEELKDFSQVQVHQLVSPGGRSSISYAMSADRKEASAVALEVARIIREGWETEKAFLIFSFVRRGSLDMIDELKRDLRHSGINLGAVTQEGLPRINWLTWGSETGSNGLEHCTSVIMAGVLHRSHLDLSAVVRGQTGNPAEPTPSARIRELVETEIAHCVLQGASRGSCRRIVDGKAVPMRLWFIHKSPTIKTILDKVMPGAEWSFPEPKHLKKAAADSRAAQLLGQLIAHLSKLPADVSKVSTQALKKLLGLPDDAATAKAWTRGLALLDLAEHGWHLDKKSLVRGAAAYGFEHQD